MVQRSQAHAALGRAIRDYRQTMAISQEELAHRSGMHRTYLGGLERGERNPTFANLTRLAEALGLRPSELLSLAEQLQDETRRR